METIKKIGIVWLMIFALGYLTGIFISAELNISNWDKEIRENLGYVILTCSVISAGLMGITIDINK